jgi:UDP-2-acetamido-3-amino-2,3-dideoxy-glucuronate N-acetyltransferase
MVEKPTCSIAVVGTGYWGKNLVRSFARLGALKLICDSCQSALLELAEKYPTVEASMELGDILDREEINGVCISTPAETHYAIAREVLLADKHVYIEKPFTLDEEEAAELIELAAKRDLVLMVGHLLQYHPAFVSLKQLAQNGELGRINYIYSNRLNLGKIRREENSLWSFAPHDISMILSLAAEEPERVISIGGYYLHEKIADVTTTHLEFPSGLKAHIFVSWLHPIKEQKLIVVGERKMAVFEDTKPWPEKLLLYPHTIHWRDHLPVPTKAEPERLNIDEKEPLQAECEHFLSCISNGTTPLTNGQEGLRVLRVLNKAQRSLNNSRILLGNNGSVTKTNDNSNLFDENHENKTFFVHDTSTVDKNVIIGSGAKIWHFCHIMSGTTIGKNCTIGQNVMIGPDVIIGDKCKIQNNVSIYKGVSLEEGVFCGPSMVFTNVYNPRAHIRRMEQIRTTLVKQGATLGANCTIVCGVVIGRYAFVGAGAVVTKDVCDHALVLGNPARRVGWMCECGCRLSEDLACPQCSALYAFAGENRLMRSHPQKTYLPQSVGPEAVTPEQFRTHEAAKPRK